MATIPANIAAFADLVAEDIQNIYVQKRGGKKLGMDQICNVATSKSYYNKDSSVIGAEKAHFMGENASVVYDAPIQGFDKVYTSKKYGTGIKITDTLWRFGVDFRGIANKITNLADAVDEKIDDDAFDLLNNSYSPSYTDGDSQSVSTSGGDAVAFASDAHTREDAGTNWNNIVTDGTTVNMDFEYDALKALRRTAALVKNGRGQQMMVEPDTLVCKYGSSVHSRYEELMGALNRNQIPGGNENDGAAKVGLPKLITSKYLDNDAYYFAFDSSFKGPEMGLQWIWGLKPDLNAPEINYDTDEYRRKVVMFYDRGGNDMRAWQFSKGTNAA